MKKLLVSLLLTLSAGSSHAWGPVEQAALLGIFGGYIIGRETSPPVVVYPPPVAHPSPYGGPPPYYNYHTSRVCYNLPVYDAYGRYVRTVRQCDRFQ